MPKIKNLAAAIKKANASSETTTTKKNETHGEIKTRVNASRSSLGGTKVQRSQGRGR